MSDIYQLQRFNDQTGCYEVVTCGEDSYDLADLARAARLGCWRVVNAAKDRPLKPRGGYRGAPKPRRRWAWTRQEVQPDMVEVRV